MDRINSQGAVVDANGHRMRVDRNLANGVAGTELSSLYSNNLQEELVGGIIEQAGLTPSAEQTNQIYTALTMLFAGINGSAEEQFAVQDATAANQAVALGQLDQPYGTSFVEVGSFSARAICVNGKPENSSTLLLSAQCTASTTKIENFTLEITGSATLQGYPAGTTSAQLFVSGSGDFGAHSLVVLVKGGDPFTIALTVNGGTSNVDVGVNMTILAVPSS